MTIEFRKRIESFHNLQWSKVKDILNQYKSSDTSTDQKKKMGQTVKTIQSINFEGIKHNQLEEIRQALEEKLQEIDQIMTDNIVGE